MFIETLVYGYFFSSVKQGHPFIDEAIGDFIGPCEYLTGRYVSFRHSFLFGILEANIYSPKVVLSV